jgi:hypothetical protein
MPVESLKPGPADQPRAPSAPPADLNCWQKPENGGPRGPRRLRVTDSDDRTSPEPRPEPRSQFEFSAVSTRDFEIVGD